MSVVGTAGWSVPRAVAEAFPEQGSALERYATVFDGVEINTSFYRRHQPKTWQRWADSVPETFRFAVKIPKVISHELRLIDAANELDVFLGDIAPLATKLGPLLLQLPPSLSFDAAGTEPFFAHLRQQFRAPVVIEPRHASWATPQAAAFLASFFIAPVLADPSPPELEQFAATATHRYLRLHGSPRIYYSSYEAEQLEHYAELLTAPESWCIFDNTASGAALANALQLKDMLRA